MADTAIIEKPSTTADALSFAEHKAIQTAKVNGTEPPKKKVEVGGAVQESDNSTEREQAEKKDKAEAAPEHKKDKSSFESRLSEATRRADSEKERADKAERELQELRAQAATKPEQKPEQRTEPSVAAKPEGTPKPKLADFIKALKDGETYEDAVERHADAVYDWRQAEARRVANEEQRRQATETRKQTVQRKVNEARQKHADFDTKLSGYNASQVMLDFFIDHPDGMEVAYALATRPADVQKILSHNTASMQVFELSRLAGELNGTGTAAAQQTDTTQERSAAPPPTKVLGGSGASGSPKKLSDAQSFLEHKRLQQARQAH